MQNTAILKKEGKKKKCHCIKEHELGVRDFTRAFSSELPVHKSEEYYSASKALRGACIYDIRAIAVLAPLYGGNCYPHTIRRDL